MDKHLHIISFDVPDPPDYGGVIDVYYKILALRKEGIKIHLHCFQYGRPVSKSLLQLCEDVHYYPRKNFVYSLVTLLPFIVRSRVSRQLEQNLLRDDYPVLFEGLHTCYLLGDKRFSGRMKIYRESNIEHRYYFNLFLTESNVFKKIFFLRESLRLKLFERKIAYADLALAVSLKDTEYLQKQFPNLKTEYLPSFHPGEDVYYSPKKEKFVLFHGNLGVPENSKAAAYLLSYVFHTGTYRFVIAGKNPPKWLLRMMEFKWNVELIADPSEEELTGLIRSAQVNILYTPRPAGLKLKLLNALFNGGFCLANPAMLSGTGLEEVCEVASSPLEFQERIKNLMEKPFLKEEKIKREMMLDKNYSNKKNAEQLVHLVFNELA